MTKYCLIILTNIIIRVSRIRRRRRRNVCIYPYINITLHKLLVGVNEFGYIRKMLNKIIWVRYLARQQKLKNERNLK